MTKVEVEKLSSRPNWRAPEKFASAALFLRLGLPSTLIRPKNGAFLKRSSKRRNLKSPIGQRSENGAFRKR